MKWQTQKKVGVGIITAGVAPLVAVMLVGLMASFTPLDTPVQLRAGVFQSPEFWTYTEDPYFVMLEADEVPGPDLDSVHCLMAAQAVAKLYRNCDGEKQTVDFDWKIVSGQGRLLASGRYEPIEYSGTGIGFAEFQAHPFARQRVILEIHQDGGRLNNYGLRLKLESRSDLGLAFPYLILMSLIFAVVVVSIGALTLPASRRRNGEPSNS
jgi:hypothetical protein